MMEEMKPLETLCLDHFQSEVNKPNECELCELLTVLCQVTANKQQLSTWGCTWLTSCIKYWEWMTDQSLKRLSIVYPIASSNAFIWDKITQHELLFTAPTCALSERTGIATMKSSNISLQCNIPVYRLIFTPVCSLNLLDYVLTNSSLYTCIKSTLSPKIPKR